MVRERFAPLINDCHLMVDSHLMPLVTQLFDNAAPVLLEFAEKAQSNTAQHRFFEAMRAVRDHRPAMENAFFADLQRQFRQIAPTGAAPGPGQRRQGDDSLSLALVDQDAYEETLALQNTVAKAQVAYAYELYGLRQRLALVIGGRKLEEEEIPGGPQQVAASFGVAARVLPLEPKTKLIVFLLFDRFVMSQLGEMYKEYNDRLILAGLLPHLKYDIATLPHAASSASAGSKQPATTAPKPPAPAAQSQSQTLGEETFAAICQLLSGRRQASAPRGGPSGPPLAQPALVSALHQVQRSDPDTFELEELEPDELIPEVPLDAQLIDRVKALLSRQRERVFSSIDRDRLASTDADVIDLVGMIFEYMLNDEGLPNAVKALLSRLHTPFLKVAILDTQFFTKESHPARQLLDAMIDAGSRYVVETDLNRGIFPYLQTVVNRVREEFEDHLGLFGVLLVELQTRVEQMRNIAEVTERRTRETATGQEKLDQARSRAAAVINARIQGRALPPSIVRLLQQSLADKLTFILLRDREGEQGAIWQTAVRVIGDIVWSTALRATEAGQHDLRTQLPGLQASLRAGLDLLGKFGSNDGERLYQQIAAAQQAALAPAAQRPPEDRPQVAARPQPVEPAVKTPAAAPVPPTADEQRILRELGQIEFGTWFDFIPGGAEPRRRLKLAWYTPVTDRYMFVDSMGVKAAVLSRRDLAREMAAGKFRVSAAEKRPFLDRALEAVRSLLGGGESASARTPAA
jgi:hypothetical protein